MMALTPKQQRFAAEYLIDLNATQAAIRAGYSAKTARSQGERLLTNVDIAGAIGKGKKRQLESIDVTASRVIAEMAKLAFSDLRQLYDANGNLLAPNEWPDDVAATVAGLEVEELFEGRGEAREKIGTLRKVKRWDKAKALEMLGRHLALFNDKLDVNVTDRLAERLEALRRRRHARQKSHD